MPKLSIEYVPIESLQPHPENPKDHDLESIIGSIERFGYRIPIDTNAEVPGSPMLAGHGRREALLEIRERVKLGRMQVPHGVWVEGQAWMVPILKGTLPLTEREVEAFILADNQTQLNGPMKEDLLQRMLENVKKSSKGLFGTGFLSKMSEKARQIGAGTVQKTSSNEEGKEGQGTSQRAAPPNYSQMGLKPLILTFVPDVFIQVTGALEAYANEHSLMGHKEAVIHLLNEWLGSKGERPIP